MRRIPIFTRMPLQRTPTISCTEDAWLRNSSSLNDSLPHISNPPFNTRTAHSLPWSLALQHYSYPSADFIGDVLKRQVKC